MACRFLLLLELTILALLVLPCEPTTYMVGDLAGWDTSADLSSWPATKHFYVGDALCKLLISFIFIHWIA
ncbi:hypothetical protein IEQ34_014287 [Dendrobium chrysotoxum]|uniref:Phytocyanin domain-containing protein n=1 Tax=Dendrobium chrysotoxum TaxID=161865 RepID=A0AAV7GKT7_DENCH|nr:hypothetical protein IEQ34_014287 [Dendrobium chrysotoxum]